MCRSIRGIVALLSLMGALVPTGAAAQLVGLGPRFSVVRGDTATNTPTTRFVGGTARLKTSGLISLEGALDFRTTFSPDRTKRVREAPLQGSVLIYPIRAAMAPYLVGGMGIYTTNYDVLAAGLVTETAQERKVGMHLGFGGEIRLAKHAVAYMDYRYRFVQFGSGDAATMTAGAPATSATTVGKTSAASKLLNSVPGLGDLNMSHKGSMWTGGVAIVF